MIKITNLNKYYNKGKSNELHVINNTTLEFEDTGLVCILGESGSGKTTLMNTISGLDNFADGTIQVDDRTITKYGSDEQERVRNEKFGYIFQNYYLLMDRTVEYNIKLALSLYDISEQEKEERIDYVLKAVDMLRFKKRQVSQLSGGQQQRIAIARALAKTPRVIFADEPTGNLDEANTLKIMSILKKLSKDCLVVVVTHERSIADFFADRIIWIADGKLEKEVKKESQGVYEYVDDTNIYLKEFQKKEYENDSIKLETYTKNNEDIDLEFKLIYENGKIFFYSENSANIEFITGDSEKKVIDSEKPKIEIEEIDNLEYSLGQIETAKKPKMGFGEIFKIAVSNLKNMGKKQAFLIISLIAMAVLIVLTVQDVMAVLTVDKQSIVTSDSHYLQIELSKNSMIKTDEFKEKISEMMTTIYKNKLPDFTYIVPNANMSYEYEGFWQLEDVKSDISDFSIVPIDVINEKDIIYGKMPTKTNEVVVDKWVLENFINEGNEFSNIITSVQHFIGKNFKVGTGSNEKNLTITGICDTKEPTVYIDKFEGIGLSSWAKSCINITKLNNLTNNKYSSYNLKNNEVLVSQSDYDSAVESYLTSRYSGYYRLFKKGEVRTRWGQSFDDWLEDQKNDTGITYEEFQEIAAHPENMELTIELKYGGKYIIKGILDETDIENLGAEVIYADAAYEEIVTDVTEYMQRFYVYTSDKKAVKDFLENKLPASIKKDINITVKDLYEQDMKIYNAAKEVKVSGRMVITFTIFIISMIILYFMMKANAIKRMADIGVYRLLGISKASITWLFAIENILLTTYTSVVGAVVTVLVTKFISSIPALGMNFIFPWYAFVGTIAFFYIINTLIGILPIRKILKLPPAQLAAKYDI